MIYWTTSILTLEYTNKLKKDFKRGKRSSKYEKTIEKDVFSIVKLLATDKKLPVRYSDHALDNNWSHHPDGHIKPDLVLIYGKTKIALPLVRLGAHSELGLCLAEYPGTSYSKSKAFIATRNIPQVAIGLE